MSIGNALKKRLAVFPPIIDGANVVSEVIKLFRRIRKEENPWKSPTTSRDYYDSYDDREQIAYYSDNLRWVRDGKRIYQMTDREARARYLAPVFAEIRAQCADKSVVKVLEVGCGNCINLIELKEEFGDAVELSGFDLSSGRLNVARTYFGDRLGDTTTSVASIVEPTPAEDRDQFDVVFSMHCLEQIPYAATQAVENLHARSRDCVIMIEPVWEFARLAQKLKLIRSDYIRTLLPAVKYHGFTIEKAEPLGFESTLKNQTSLVVLRK